MTDHRAGQTAQGRRASWLVVSLSSLSITAVLVLASVLFTALQTVSHVNDRLTSVQHDAMAELNALEEDITANRRELLASINLDWHGSIQASDSEARARMLAHADMIERLFAQSGGIQGTVASTESLRNSIARIFELIDRVRQWRADSLQTRRATQAATEDLDARLAAMCSSIDSVKGKARLERLGALAKFRHADDAQALAIARSTLMSADRQHDLEELQTDAIELRVLVHELVESDSIDQLAHLKDNRFTPTFARLRDGFRKPSINESLKEAMSIGVLEDIARDMVGAGAIEANDSGSRSQPDNLHRLCLRHIGQIETSEHFSREVAAKTTELNDARFGLLTALSRLTTDLSAQSTRTLVSEVRIVITATIAAVVIVVALSVRLGGSIHRQVRLLEQVNTALEEAGNAAQMATRAKSEFLANMSHEIRTPMTAILGYAELLQSEDCNEQDRQDQVRIIRRNGEHLLGIINDVLDLSKIEAGRMTVEHVRCSLCQVVSETAALMRVRAAGKGLRLEVEYIFPVPAEIESDPLRLRQILVNLVGNAVKFTEQGSVRIRVHCEHVAAGGHTIAIEIADTGIGLSTEQLASLFRPFTQADGSTTRKYGGTGLGLTISRHFAQLLGGDIVVQSTPGAGSTFTVTVSTGALEGVRMITSPSEAMLTGADDTAAGPSIAFAGRILLAEDGPDNQRLISYHLRKAGADVKVVSDGRQAVEAVAAGILTDKPFGVVLMDMQMPVMDGYAATRELRRRGITTPVIALTAHAMSSDRDKCLAAGCSDYATKPIDREALVEVCARWMRRKMPPLADAA